jgi:hypothetical protein
MAGFSSRTDHALSWRERQDASDSATAAEFLAACRKADADALAPWAPAVTDYTGIHVVGASRPKRTALMHELLSESLDFTDGPCMSEAMQLILNVAHGANLAQAPEQARQLLQRMAAKWAAVHGPEVE